MPFFSKFSILEQVAIESAFLSVFFKGLDIYSTLKHVTPETESNAIFHFLFKKFKASFKAHVYFIFLLYAVLTFAFLPLAFWFGQYGVIQYIIMSFINIYFCVAAYYFNTSRARLPGLSLILKSYMKLNQLINK